MSLLSIYFGLVRTGVTKFLIRKVREMGTWIENFKSSVHEGMSL
jgi:hypothetical protein